MLRIVHLSVLLVSSKLLLLLLSLVVLLRHLLWILGGRSILLLVRLLLLLCHLLFLLPLILLRRLHACELRALGDIAVLAILEQNHLDGVVEMLWLDGIVWLSELFITMSEVTPILEQAVAMGVPVSASFGLILRVDLGLSLLIDEREVHLRLAALTHVVLRQELVHKRLHEVVV